MTQPEPKYFPKLYKTTSKGAEQAWWIRVIPVPTVGSPLGVYDCADIVTTHGQVGGAMQNAVVHVTKGKNVGKKNETTPFDQACSEAESKWKKQLDKGYSQERGGASMDLKPMLAHKYEDRKDKVDFAAAYVQPKLDGVRALAFRDGDTIRLISRQGKEHKGLEHIRQALLKVMPNGTTWDGELYIYGRPFQDIISLVKKPQPGSEDVCYHVYDQVSPAEFADRNFSLALALDPDGTEAAHPRVYPDPCLVLVPTICVRFPADVEAFHQKYVNDGYEGVMLRWGSAGYKSGYRSEHLLKVKAFQDAEFEIVDVVPGVGKEADKGTFVCKTDKGAVFNARPKGRDENRAEYLANKAKYVGKKLTVQFFEWTTTEPPVPRFPVGVAVRDYE